MELISKSKIMRTIEEKIAEREREFKRGLYAEDVVEVYAEINALKEIYDEIKDMPVLSGKWINVDTSKESKHWKCSCCNGLVETAHYCYDCYYEFCPNCGAEMKKR